MAISYMVWKELPEIDIVYHHNPDNCIEVDGISYPKAYIVGHGDKKAMESARSWAFGWGYHENGPSLKVVTTQNDGFAIRIAKAADNSFNSGKLSFWMCVFEKDGVEPFATGINSELLCLLITQSTLVNGCIQGEKVFFARCNGQLGILHEHMHAYQEYKKVIDRKKSVATGKTTKWQLGNVYGTVTRRDVMMGNLVMPLKRVKQFDIFQRTTIYTLDFNSKPMKIFGSEETGQRTYSLGLSLENGDGPDKLDAFEACLAEGLQNPQDKCPSRHCEGPAAFATDSHEQKLITALDKICTLTRTRLQMKVQRSDTIFYDITNWVRLTAFHLALCELSRECGLDALDKLEEAIQRYIADTEPTRFFPCELVHDGITEQFEDMFAVIARIVELARAHYGSQS